MAKTFSYNKLWKLLIDRNLKLTYLKRISVIITASLAKLGKNDNINTSVLLKICEALDCEIEDIMEVVEGVPAAFSAEQDEV